MSPREKRQVGRILNTRREASLSSWQEHRIGSTLAADYAAERTAVLLPRKTRVQIEPRTTAGSYAVKINRRRGLSLGSAAAISSDGYYLTAAHCVEGDPLQLILWQNDRPVALPARLVWSGGGPENGRADLAIVKVDPIRQPNRFFPLADDTVLRRGLPVLTSGFGELRPTQSAGRVRKVGRPQELEGAHWRELRHNAPVAPGDSGGPVLNAHGRLLGVNSQIYVVPLLKRNQVWFYNASAYSPNPSWLQEVIEQDRRKMKARG